MNESSTMSHTPTSDRERRLDEVIAAYMAAVDHGESPDHAAWIAQNPDVASELRSYFADEDRWNARHGEPATNPVFLCPAKPARAGLRRGQVLANRYEIFDVRYGGMGCVYLADDLQLRQPGRIHKVAIKTVADRNEWLDTRFASEQGVETDKFNTFVARFRREAQNWIRLGHHSNIIRAWWVLEVGGKPHLVLEFANSGDLSSWIGTNRLTLPLCVNFAVQFCAGMIHAHTTTGVLHRDIKPSNVLIHDDRVIKITDFGLSKVFDAASDEGESRLPDGESFVTRGGLGTPAYMAPEQFQNASTVDARSDIFSFGAMLFEMLTGNRLFEGRSWQEHYSLRRLPLPASRSKYPCIPTRLWSLVARCIAFDPADRFDSFETVQTELELIQRDLTEPMPIPIGTESEATENLSHSQRLQAESYSLNSLGLHGRAAETAEKAIEIDPNNWVHWVNLSKSCIDMGDYRRAEGTCRRAVELAPHQAVAWANLGWVQLQLDDPTGALESACRAITCDETFADAWACRGCAENSLGNHDMAVDSLRRAVELAPHDGRAFANLGFALLALDRFAEAMSALQRACELQPDIPLAWLQLGWLSGRKGDWQSARSAMDRHLQLAPESADGWALRAWIFWEGFRDREAARACLRNAATLDPENARARAIAKFIRSGSP